MNAKSKKVLSIIGNTILWLFVIFAVCITAVVISSTNSKHGVASFGGKSLINIQTDSMKPEFKSGDMIIIKLLAEQDKSALKEGDVITYKVDLDGDGTEELNTHRIVKVNNENGIITYTTRGDNGDNDNNPDTVAQDDPYSVAPAKIVGRWTGTKVGGIGNVLSFLQSKTGFLLVIVVPLVLFFLFELVKFILALTKVKGGKKLTAEEEEEIKRRAIEEFLRQQNAGKSGETDYTTPADENTENDKNDDVN
ncbi:MAG: signal peptidase I [Eubacteriales bacterium]|jgi:signal peptidase